MNFAKIGLEVFELVSDIDDTIDRSELLSKLEQIINSAEKGVFVRFLDKNKEIILQTERIYMDAREAEISVDSVLQFTSVQYKDTKFIQICELLDNNEIKILKTRCA